MNAVTNKISTETAQVFKHQALNEQHAAEILKTAQDYAVAHDLAYSGALPPQAAWALAEAGFATLVDIRTNEERKFVGYVADIPHVAWATGTAFNRNPRFVRELEAKVKKDQVVLLLCRSGNRSALAAEAAFKAGFTQVYNVLEGFEGDLDDDQRRGQANGWRFHGLPWQQD